MVRRAQPIDPKSIVIIQLAQLGDMVCTTPMFRAVKNKYPHSRLIVVGNPAFKDLLALNSDIDVYIGFSNINETAKVLEKYKPDFGCAATTGFKGLATLFLAGVPSISAPLVTGGFNPPQTFLYRLLAKLCFSSIFEFGKYVPRLMLALLAPLGIQSEDTSKHLAFSEEAGNYINDFLARNGVLSGDLIIGISPSSGNKIKNWGGRNFGELANRLFELHNARVIISGTSGDQQEINEMKSVLKPENRAIFALGLDLDNFKALISKLSLFVAVDTGPIYIAEAFGVPTVDIVGPVDENEQPPRGKKHRTVALPNRIPEVHILNARVYNQEEARRQIENISVSSVLAECSALINQIHG